MVLQAGTGAMEIEEIQSKKTCLHAYPTETKCR